MKQILKEAVNKNKKPLPQAMKQMESVILAIDSRKKNDPQVKKNLEVLRSFRYQDKNIIPVTVFTPLDLGWFMPIDKDKKTEMLSNIKEEVGTQWKKLGLDYKKSGFLITSENSTRDKAIKLIQFAVQNKAKTIIVGSGAKSRSELTGLGSFSETLISLSPLPVIVVGESVETVRPVSKIMFPTDFSDASHSAFRKTVDYAKKSGAEVILYHYLDIESGPLAYGIPWGYEIKWLDEYWKVQEDLQMAEGKKWRDWSLNEGVKCRFLYDRKLGGLRSRVVELTQELNVDLVVLSVKRGPWSQVILGRNVRSLFAHAICPVMAIHSKIKDTKLHS